MRDFASLGSGGCGGKIERLSALARRHKNEIITERNSQLDARSLGADVRWNARHDEGKQDPSRRIGRTTLNSNVTPHCCTVGASATLWEHNLAAHQEVDRAQERIGTRSVKLQQKQPLTAAPSSMLVPLECARVDPLIANPHERKRQRDYAWRSSLGQSDMTTLGSLLPNSHRARPFGVTTCDNLFTRIAAGLKFDERLWL
ncbi:hypothetical protein ACVWXL_008919 [Bradyrhizobium sp. GM22.5]